MGPTGPRLHHDRCGGVAPPLRFALRLRTCRTSGLFDVEVPADAELVGQPARGAPRRVRERHLDLAAVGESLESRGEARAVGAAERQADVLADLGGVLGIAV